MEHIQKVCLICTPIDINPHNKSVSFRDENLGFVPPLSLMLVAALMEREGVEVDLIDMEAEGLSYPATLERVRSFAPDLLGFTGGALGILVSAGTKEKN